LLDLGLVYGFIPERNVNVLGEREVSVTFACFKSK
jgi:hypothetical protein